MAIKKKKTYKAKKKAKAKTKLSPQLMAQLRREALKELEHEQVREQARLEEEQRVQRSAHQKYIETMHASLEPWVELQSWADTPQGVKVELEWNDAFVGYLRKEGIEGTDDDQVVQKWVALLLMEVNDRMENPEDAESKFE